MPRQKRLHFIQRAFDPHPRGIFREPQVAADISEGTIFKKSGQQRVRILLAESVQRSVQMLAELFPVRVRFGSRMYFLQGGGLLFARTAAAFRAHEGRCDIARCRVQPAGQNGMPPAAVRFPGEGCEHLLGYVLGEVSVAADPGKAAPYTNPPRMRTGSATAVSEPASA